MAQSALYNEGVGSEVDITDDPGRSLGIVEEIRTSIDAAISNEPLDVSGGTVEVTDDTTFNVNRIGNPVPVEDSTGTTINPATEDSLTTTLPREIAEWTAGSLSVTSAQEGNWSSLNQFTHSTGGTSAEALPSNSVPDGVEIIVEYQESNSGTVYVGDSGTQESPLTATGDARTFKVSDTSAVYIQTPTSGDGVVVTYES